MITRIAVVEDDGIFRKKVVNALLEECKRKQFDVEVEAFSDGRRLMGMLDDHRTFDAYFLDIQMGYMTGVQLAECIRKVDEEAVIIFLTAHEGFAIQGYSYRIFDYLLKANWRSRLPRVVDRVKGECEKRQTRMYLIRNEIRWEAVYFRDILYLDKQRKNVIFHCKDEKIYQERVPLKQVYMQLPKDIFVHINRGQVVNLKHVVYMDREIVKLSDNTVLDISRYALDEVRKQMTSLGRVW